MISVIGGDVASIIVQDYGPIGILGLMLWYRQGQIVDATVTLAEQHEDVDEGDIEDKLSIGGDD